MNIFVFDFTGFEFLDLFFTYGILLFILIMIVNVSIVIVKKRNKMSKNNVSKSQKATNKYSSINFRYYKQKDDFITHSESILYKSMQTCVGDKAAIFAKVRLADIFSVESDEYLGKNVFWKHFREISQKHVDFLICNNVTLKPLLAIELDDPSHDNRQSQVNDAFKDELFNRAKLPMHRFNVKDINNAEYIEKYMNQYLE